MQGTMRLLGRIGVLTLALPLLILALPELFIWACFRVSRAALAMAPAAAQQMEDWTCG